MISADINQTRYCICSEPWKLLILQRQLQMLWSLLKGKKEKRKQEPQTVKALEGGFWRFLEVSGGQWGAQLPQGAPQRKHTVLSTPSTAQGAVSGTEAAQTIVYSMELQLLVCLETTAANVPRNLFCSLYSEGFSTTQIWTDPLRQCLVPKTEGRQSFVLQAVPPLPHFEPHVE